MTRPARIVRAGTSSPARLRTVARQGANRRPSPSCATPRTVVLSSRARCYVFSPALKAASMLRPSEPPVGAASAMVRFFAYTRRISGWLVQSTACLCPRLGQAGGTRSNGALHETLSCPRRRDRVRLLSAWASARRGEGRRLGSASPGNPGALPRPGTDRHHGRPRNAGGRLLEEGSGGAKAFPPGRSPWIPPAPTWSRG